MNDTEQLLLVDLRGIAPAHLIPSPAGENIHLRGEELHCGDYPFPVCADLLVEQDTREFCGLSFSLRYEFSHAISAIFAGCSSKIVRLFSVSTPMEQREDPIPSYASLTTAFEPYAHLDIVWASRLGVDVEMAQLGVGELAWWYGSREHGKPMAVSVQDIGRVLGEFGLTLPSI
jgi:hypothetical protein